MVNLVFDYDGTLHDCLKIYAPAFLHAYACMVDRGRAPERTFSEGELSRWLGFSAKEMWDSFAPDLPQEEKEHYSGLIGQEMLRQIQEGNARLYPGIPEALAQLKELGYRLIFLSNCKRSYMEAHRAYFKLDKFFTAFYCAEDHGWKRKPEIFTEIQRCFSGSFLIIGDRLQDMEIAQQHGLPAIGCGYGYGRPEELAYADFIVNASTDLVETVKNFPIR